MVSIYRCYWLLSDEQLDQRRENETNGILYVDNNREMRFCDLLRSENDKNEQAFQNQKERAIDKTDSKVLRQPRELAQLIKYAIS